MCRLLPVFCVFLMLTPNCWPDLFVCRQKVTWRWLAALDKLQQWNNKYLTSKWNSSSPIMYHVGFTQENRRCHTPCLISLYRIISCLSLGFLRNHKNRRYMLWIGHVSKKKATVVTSLDAPQKPHKPFPNYCEPLNALSHQLASPPVVHR